MSTNYYLRTADTPAADEGIHLGKLVMGKPFIFRGSVAIGVTDFESWHALAGSGQIVTESGTPVSLDDLVDVINSAHNQWQRFQTSSPRPHDQVDDANGNRFTLVEFC